MMLASRLLLAVYVVALCSHRAQSVFVSIVGNTNGILDLECREGGPISNAVFHITNLRTGNSITVQQDHYTLDIEDDSRIRCSIMADSEQSSPIQFAAVPDDHRTEMERCCAYEGQPVFLKCPYRRGPIGEYYSIQWLNVSPDLIVPEILDSRDVQIDNNTFDATTVSDASPEIDYACELTLNRICNATNSNCGNTVRRRGPAIEVTTYSGPQSITPSEVITASTLCLSSAIDSQLTTTQLPVFPSETKATIASSSGLSPATPQPTEAPTDQPHATDTSSPTSATPDLQHMRAPPWPIILVAVLAVTLLTIATVLVTVGCTFGAMKMMRRSRRRTRIRERVQLETIKQSTSTTSITAVGDGSNGVVMQHTKNTTETNFTSPLHGDSGNYTQSTENTTEVQAITMSAGNPTAVALTPLSHGSVPIGFRDVESLPTPMAQRSIGKQPSLYSGQLSRSYVPSTHPSSVCTVSGQLEVIECVQPTSFIPFIEPLEVFLCSSYGGVYKTPHDVSIRIPKGAIPEGSTFRIEFGIALYGPFYYPGNSKAISPIILLRVFPDNVGISKFLMPVKIKLPHYFDLCEDDIAQEKVGFMIASQEDEDEIVSFRPGVSEHCSFIPKQQHGSIATEEFSETCYYCLTCREHSELSVSRGLYTLVKVVPQPIPAKAWDMHFCITYSMKPFVETIRRQYRGSGFKVSAQPQWRFKFSPPESEDGEPAIEIALQQHQRQAGWQLTVEPNVQQIELLELDVWRNDPMQLCSQEEDRLYPPRFTIEVSGEAAVQSSEVLVSFTGIEERFAGKMRTKVSLPYIQQQGLGQAVVPCYAAAAPPHPTHSMHMNQTVVPYSLPQAGYPIAIQGRYHQQITYTETQRDPSEPSDEELTEAAKDITGILRSSWPMLLTYLKIPKHLAADIETDKSLLSAISRTLQVWRSLNTSANMREDLAGLLEKTDQRLHSVGRKLREGGGVGGGGVRRCLPPV